jgi:hypothetical protein
MKTALRIGLLSLVATASVAAPTVEDVGDPESFGRAVKYLGVKTTSRVLLSPNCAVPVAADGTRCRRTPPSTTPGSVTINESALASMRLPGNSARSLLCLSIQSFGRYGLWNNTSNNTFAGLSLAATITIQSEVFLEPQVVNHIPNGRLIVQPDLFTQTKYLAPYGQEQASLSAGENCLGGLVTRQSLMKNGLTSEQAARFFARPISLTFGLAGSGAAVDYADIAYGARVYGD